MITVTERTKEELKERLIDCRVNSDEGQRLMPSHNGPCILLVDNELSGDRVVEYEGN